MLSLISNSKHEIISLLLLIPAQNNEPSVNRIAINKFVINLNQSLQFDTEYISLGIRYRNRCRRGGSKSPGKSARCVGISLVSSCRLIQGKPPGKISTLNSSSCGKAATPQTSRRLLKSSDWRARQICSWQICTPFAA